MENPSKPELTSSFGLFKKSKDLVLANANTFGILLLLPFLFGLFSNIRSRDASFFERAASPDSPLDLSGKNLGLVIAIGLVLVVFNVIVTLMLYILSLESTKGLKPTITDLWQQLQKYGFRLFLLSLVLAIIIGLGFLALIIPGIIFIGQYFLAPYAMLDKNLSIEDSLKESARISKPYFGYVWGVILVTIVLSLPAVVPVFGWIISFALTSLYTVAPALRYQELKKISV